MPNKERISELDIGDGKLYEFAGANSGIVFNTIADAQAAITAGTVKEGDVFYVKYVSQGGTEIDAAGVEYDNTESGLDANNVQDAVDEIAENIGTTDISDIGDGSVTGAVSQINSDLSKIFPNYSRYYRTDVGTVDISSVESNCFLFAKIKNSGNSNYAGGILVDNQLIGNVENGESVTICIPIKKGSSVKTKNLTDVTYHVWIWGV